MTKPPSPPRSRPVPAERYEARFGPHQRATVLHAEGGEAVLPNEGRVQPNAPSFWVEAGKPLTITALPDLFGRGGEQVDFFFHLAEQPELGRVALSDGTRGPDGALSLRPVTVNVPEDAAGVLRLRFCVTDAAGKARTVWGPDFDAVVIPSEGARLLFGEDWSVTQQGTLRRAGKLELAYDADRLRALLGGEGPTELFVHVSFDGAPPLTLPLDVRGKDGLPLPGRTVSPAVRVPALCQDVRVWFSGRSGDQEAFDSRFGQDFHFTPEDPLPDADPDWKRQTLQLQGCERLRADNFVALGPPGAPFDCIAWSLGFTDRIVWPGNAHADAFVRERRAAAAGPGSGAEPEPEPVRWPASPLEGFDLLYAAAGFAPLPTPDVSFEPGVEKVALFAHVRETPHGRSVAPTHAARMDAEGRWTSKLGHEALIRHDDVHVVGGKSYGEVFRVYARPRPGPTEG